MNTTKKTVALAHKTWLAGVGALGVGREKTANKFDQLFVDGSAFVNDLLEKGESIETQIQAKLETRKMLKDKISALRSKLGFGNEGRDQQVDALSQRVDSLIEVVAKLAQRQLAEKKATTAVSTTKKELAKSSAVNKASIKTPAKAATKSVSKAVVTKTSAKPKVVASKPVTAKPVVSEPVTAKPVVSEPVTAKPVASDPATAKPIADKKD